jgi:hypothetical protein
MNLLFYLKVSLNIISNVTKTLIEQLKTRVDLRVSQKQLLDLVKFKLRKEYQQHQLLQLKCWISSSEKNLSCALASCLDRISKNISKAIIRTNQYAAVIRLKMVLDRLRFLSST